MMMIDLAVYRCYRGNALWFASLRQDAYSVTVRDGLTFSFAKGEMMGWAQYWLDRSLEYWNKLQLADVPGAEVYRCGSNAGSTTDAQNAGTQLATDPCICPDCTRRAMNLDLDKSGRNVIE